MTKQNKTTLQNIILVAVLLIIAYIFRMISRQMTDTFLPTLLTMLRAIIHVSIVLIWTISLRRRVVNIQVRRLLVSSGLLMAMWLVAKNIKWEFFTNNTEPAVRYLWYSFYIPMVMIPCLGIFITQFIGKPDSYRLPKWTYFCYVPAILISLGVLTNDLHNLAFAFPNGIEMFDSDYTYGFVYWCAMVWYVGLSVAFVANLLRKSRVPGSKMMQQVPIFVMLGAIVFWLLYTLKIINGDLSVIDCILIGTLLETAIQAGLVPTNSSYTELFKNTTVPVIIVDDDYNAKYTSGGAMPVNEEEMRESKSGTVAIGNTLLSSAPIRAGRVLWQDDVTILNRQREELDDVRESLAEESVLIRAETEIKENQAKADEKNRLYDRIARDVKPQLVIISSLLDKAEKGENVKNNLTRVAVMGSYVKRRGNLLLIGSERGVIPIREVENAIRESSDNLRLIGIDVSLAVSGNLDIPLDYALKVYDLYERVVEVTLDSMTAIFIRLKSINDKIQLSIQIGANEGASENALKSISSDGRLSVEIEDEDIYVDFVIGGAGE